MKVTLEGDPQEIMTLLASLASQPQVLSQIDGNVRAEQLAPAIEPTQAPRSSSQVKKKRGPQKKTYLFNPQNADPNSVKERAYRAIREKPGMTMTQIGAAIDLDRRSVNSRVRELCLAERVRNENGRYYLTDRAIAAERLKQPMMAHYVQMEAPQITLPIQTSPDDSKAPDNLGVKKRILNLLKERGPMKADKIKAVLGLPSTSLLHARLGEMHKDGQLSRIPEPLSGVYIYRFVSEEKKAKATS